MFWTRRCPVERKQAVARTVANSIAAVWKVKQSSASTTTSAIGGAAVLTSPKPSVIKEIMDSIQELRDALELRIPHRRITNMRKILPKIGQTVITTCSRHNLYYSRPGDLPARKVIAPLYIDAAAPGKQYVVLDTTVGDIGFAHYSAVRINIAAVEDKPVYAWLNMKVRYFEWDLKGRRNWTSGYMQNWWCKTCVDETYFSAFGEAAKRLKWENDRSYDRSVDDVTFKPLGWNPSAKSADKFFSKTAATRLRHGNPGHFINGVAMDISTFVDMMIRECKWNPHRSNWDNWHRYKLHEYGYTWDVDGVCAMLAHCSDYPRFALMTVRHKTTHRKEGASGSDEPAEEHHYIDIVIGSFAIQGHSTIKAHPHMFGWTRLHWQE